jgi:hypothetical protein
MHGLTGTYKTFMLRAKNALGIDRDDDMDEKSAQIAERYSKLIERNIYEVTEDPDIHLLSKGSNVRPFSTPAMIPIILTPVLKKVSPDEGAGVASHEILIYMTVTDENMDEIVMMPLNPIGAMDLAKRLIASVCSAEELYNKHLDSDGNLDMVAISGSSIDMCMDNTDHHFVTLVSNNESKTSHLMFCCKGGLQKTVTTIQEVLDESE